MATRWSDKEFLAARNLDPQIMPDERLHSVIAGLHDRRDAIKFGVDEKCEEFGLEGPSGKRLMLARLWYDHRSFFAELAQLSDAVPLVRSLRDLNGNATAAAADRIVQNTLDTLVEITTGYMIIAEDALRKIKGATTPKQLKDAVDGYLHGENSLETLMRELGKSRAVVDLSSLEDAHRKD